MKAAINLILLAFAVISCSNNDDIAENSKPAEKNIYSFKYDNYLVQNVVLYKGPSGQKTNPDESYLGSQWSLYKVPAWEKINLDLAHHSMQLISGSSSDIVYDIKISKDSVFIADDNEWQYIGNFNVKEANFTLKRSFKYIKKMPRNTSDALLISRKSIFGTTEFDAVFGKSFFISPSEMTKPEDEVLWSNIDYYYKSL